MEETTDTPLIPNLNSNAESNHREKAIGKIYVILEIIKMSKFLKIKVQNSKVRLMYKPVYLDGAWESLRGHILECLPGPVGQVGD